MGTDPDTERDVATAIRHRQTGNLMKHILVVDDEPGIAQICRDYLERAGFAVVTAANGADAVTLARAKQPDLIVLDLGLPKMDGLDVTRSIRSHSNVPIIMLTARVDEGDRVAGLELGADDYITKPFSPRELVARVRAVFRRAELGTTRGDVVRSGGITLDLPRMQARVGKRAVELTSTEFELLTMLMRQPGRIFTRGQLLDAIRGAEAEPYDRAIDAHVKNLRRKIEPDPRAPRYVLTVYGVGYRFVEP
jgi:two-component system alkaline phosphatase synthesis response regulator PhoP